MGIGNSGVNLLNEDTLNEDNRKIVRDLEEFGRAITNRKTYLRLPVLDETGSLVSNMLRIPFDFVSIYNLFHVAVRADDDLVATIVPRDDASVDVEIVRIPYCPKHVWGTWMFGPDGSSIGCCINCGRVNIVEGRPPLESPQDEDQD